MTSDQLSVRATVIDRPDVSFYYGRDPAAQRPMRHAIVRVLREL
jgi:hypothetical protein